MSDSTRIVIAGAGALGSSAVMAAKVAGAGIIVAIDRHANRLELAERYGATATISTSPDLLAAAIQAATGGGSDDEFDTTGNAGVVHGLYEGLDNIGTLGMAGVGFGEIAIDFLSLTKERVSCSNAPRRRTTSIRESTWTWWSTVPRSSSPVVGIELVVRH